MPRFSDEPVIEFHIALATVNYQRLAKYYAAGLGIKPADIWDSD
ncbi:MAG: hypothetical protein R3300_15945 [Candidatus Promineifilaceae bacterium]|nr:hypothetical protein [Candidatus Promineifilaceae bacterium]